MHSVLQQKLQIHSKLAPEDVKRLDLLSWEARSYGNNQDVVRQGDKPDVSAIVLQGMVGRYQSLPDGRRQYISFHIAGDLPDAQSLFIDEMDHGVCAVGRAEVGLIPHRDILDLFEDRPTVGFAIWRETLLDAAIFREAVVNNSARQPVARMAHFFCERYYRARVRKLAELGSCPFPLTQTHLAEALGMSIVTANRTLQKLRQLDCVDHVDGVLSVRDWERLAAIGEFNPSYLHLRAPRLV